MKAEEQKKSKTIIRRVIAVLFWLMVWEGASLCAGSSLILPGPVPVLTRFFTLLRSPEAYAYAGMTLLRVGLGFLAAVAVGTALAALAGAIPFFRELILPPLAAVRAAPVASFILLALLWFTRSLVPAFISFLMVLPLVFTNVLTGIRSTDGKLLEVARVFRLSRSEVLREIYIPSVQPYFLSACTTGLGFAWKAGVAAEVLATPAFSVGARLYEAKLYLETEDLFAWTLLVVLLSVLLERLLKKAIFRAQRGKSA